MSFLEERLSKYLEDDEFRKAWEESEEQYERDRDLIIQERIKRLDENPDTSIAWKDIRKGN